jgi:hypothetical protein
MTYSDRLTICTTCAHFEPTLQRCKLCGCFMQLKARIPQAKCPDGRW